MFNPARNATATRRHLVADAPSPLSRTSPIQSAANAAELDPAALSGATRAQKSTSAATKAPLLGLALHLHRQLGPTSRLKPTVLACSTHRPCSPPPSTPRRVRCFSSHVSCPPRANVRPPGGMPCRRRARTAAARSGRCPPALCSRWRPVAASLRSHGHIRAALLRRVCRLVKRGGRG